MRKGVKHRITPFNISNADYLSSNLFNRLSKNCKILYIAFKCVTSSWT